MNRRPSAPIEACLACGAWFWSLGSTGLVQAQLPDPPGQVKPGQSPKHEAYLFAQMLSVAASLAGPWFQVSGNTHHLDWDKYQPPTRVRHGCMLPITRPKYDALIRTFGFTEP